MTRSRFRSQPALQRSGGRTLPAILVLCIVVGIALSAAALFKVVTPGSDRMAAAAPVDEPADLLAEATPGAEDFPAALQAATIQPQSQPTVSNPPPARAKARTAVRTAHKAKLPNYPVLKPPTPQEAWERQKRDYDRARDVYDANERAEGFRWAQQNRIKVSRHCRAAQQRTAAFMQGCMNYLRPRQAKARDREPEDTLALVVVR